MRFAIKFCRLRQHAKLLVKRARLVAAVVSPQTLAAIN
jgi:hypothetical protein